MGAKAEAVIFDCDGLLLDTEDLWMQAESDLLEEYGREYGERERKMLLGASIRDLGGTLAEILDRPDQKEELAEELLSRCWEKVVGGAVPRPGAARLVEECLSMPDRMPIGVASNSPRALVEAALGTAGFSDAFDLVVGADDVREPKPAPEIYLRSCEALGAHPARSIALEDSPTGVAAARSAGLYVIGVPSAQGVVLDAHEVFRSLTDAAVRRTLSLPIP